MMKTADWITCNIEEVGAALNALRQTMALTDIRDEARLYEIKNAMRSLVENSQRIGPKGRLRAANAD